MGRPGPARRRLRTRQLADRSNLELARTFDTVVCTTARAAEEFLHLDGPRPVLVPLGVDVDRFRYRLDRGDAAAERGARVRLVMVNRLSREKEPELAVATVFRAARPRRGSPARRRRRRPATAPAAAACAGLPVRWLGFVLDRDRLAALMAETDVALAPGPVETFGLAALESLACGTPAVVNIRSALPGVVGPHAGRAATGTGAGFADAVQDLLDVPEVARRLSARARATEFPWDATVRAFLDVHQRALSGTVG